MRAPVWLMAAVVAACAGLLPCAARAQTPPAEIEVRVSDAAGVPVADARVYVNGPLNSSSLTPRDGAIRFSDVEPGLYRIRVTRGGYDTVDVNDVEALAGRRKIVDVTLNRTPSKSAAKPVASAIPVTGATASPAPGVLQEIGRVRSRPPVSISDVDVDEGNPIRRISENLADALDKIAGVSVNQGQQGNTLTISLRNGDPSQTAGSIGGARIAGPAAGTLQAIAADLSTGVSVDANSNVGAVGGSVNFRTLEPTRTWQAQASVSYGSYERSSAQLSLSGSDHKLGIALQHATRGADSVLTGLRFLDTSGRTYVHDGSSDRLGDFVKLRYPVGKVTFTGSYLSGTTRSSPLCDQWVTTLPCGYGPGGQTTSHANLASVQFQGQIGNVTLSGNANRNAFHSTDRELGRVVGGVPSPFTSDRTSLVTGFSDYSTVALRRHTFLLNLGTYSGNGSTTTTGRFQGVAPIVVRQAYTVVGDMLKFSDRWSATLAYGSNVSLAQSQSAADLNVTLTPSRQESLSFFTGVYGSGTSYVETGFFGDPAGATYNCPAGNVRVDGPADAALPGLYNSAALSYSRRGKRGSIRVNAYNSLSRGGSLDAQFPLAALTGGVPPGYLGIVEGFWHQGAICGAQAFDPARVFISERIAGPSVRSRGLDASGQIVLGRNVIALPSYAINSATLASTDRRLIYPNSAYAVGTQLPYRPLHKAGLLLDAVQPRASLEWVVNGSWTSGNNPNSLGSYILVSSGVTWTAPRGRLSLFANNLFNSDTGLFAGTEFVQPLGLRGGGTYVPVPTLLQPRTYTLLYSVRAGRLR